MRILLAFMVFGLLFGLLTELNALSIGDKAPDFSLQDQKGSMINMADYKDNVVVLEWINPDCPYVKRHYSEGTMKELAEKHGDKIVWLAVNSTHYMDSKVNSDWTSKYLIKYAILNDSSGKVGKSYGAKTTPHMFIVKDGVVIYNGAIDNDKWGKSEKRINYVDLGLGEVLNGKAITTSETKPYGCSVKYK